MKKYLIKSSAFTLALAMVLGLASCKDDVQVETATDVAAVESASDIVTTASTTSQTEATTEVVTEIVTDAQGNTQVVTVTLAEGATTAKSDTKASTNGNSKASPATKATAKTTKKTTTVKATTKSAAKATTKATTKKTTTTTKAQGLTEEDYQWVLNEALKYIETLPKAEIDKSAEGYSSEGTYVNYSKTKEAALKRVIANINTEYDNWTEANGVGMNVKLCKDEDNVYYYAVRYVYH